MTALPWPLMAFVGALVVFHTSEFLLAAVFMRSELSRRSWLISKAYCIAFAGGLAEYVVEWVCFPILKQQVAVSAVGLALVLVGEGIRKVAMITARTNFTHDIRMVKVQEHTLVTGGIYRYCRHPGYLGWFMWAVGTQLLLANPLSTVVFSLVVWRFFRERIRFEEYHLRRIFGAHYDRYAAATPTLIPFIR